MSKTRSRRQANRERLCPDARTDGRTTPKHIASGSTYRMGGGIERNVKNQHHIDTHKNSAIAKPTVQQPRNRSRQLFRLSIANCRVTSTVLLRRLVLSHNRDVERLNSVQRSVAYALATYGNITYACRRGRLKTQVRICNGGKRKYSNLKSI